MSVLLSIPIVILFVKAGMGFNIPPDQILFMSAIIVAGGLAGMKE